MKALACQDKIDGNDQSTTAATSYQSGNHWKGDTMTAKHSAFFEEING